MIYDCCSAGVSVLVSEKFPQIPFALMKTLLQEYNFLSVRTNYTMGII